MRIGITSAQDFMALLVRRKWWVVAPFIGLSFAVAILANFLPKVFISETLVLVRPRDVPEEFVKDLIAGTAEQRLRAIQQTVLSRTNLIQILREFGDRVPEFQRLNLDEQVVKLRDQIDIVFELERAGPAPTLTYFRILYQNQNPELAQRITSKLTTLFIEQDNRVRENQVFGTTEFLSGELEKLSEQLRESEEKLREVKTSRQFELPDQLEANLRALDRLVLDKKTNAEALDRYATLRLNLESQILQTPESLPKPVQVVPAAAVNPLVEEYRKARQEYVEVAAKYTAKHPEVQAAQARLDRLKQQIPAEVLDSPLADPAAFVTGGAAALDPNPLYQRMVAQLQEVKKEIEIRERERVWIESEILKYGRRIDNTPKTEQDIAEVVRHNEDLKKRSNDLKDKLAQAELAESLESKQKGSQFVVVDPANYPLEPAKPKKINVILGGVFASLMFSIALALAVDVARQKVWKQSEIEAFWGVPVLVDIPSILTDSDLQARRRKRVWYATSSVAGALAWGVCLYLMYANHNLIIQRLDPVLQRLVYR